MGRLQHETHPIQYSAARQLSWEAVVPIMPHRVPASRRACRRSSVVGITETYKGQLRPPGPPHGIGSETDMQGRSKLTSSGRGTSMYAHSVSTSPHSRVYLEATGFSLSTGSRCCPTRRGGPPGPRIANGFPEALSRETHQRQGNAVNKQHGTGGGDRLAFPPRPFSAVTRHGDGQRLPLRPHRQHFTA